MPQEKSIQLSIQLLDSTEPTILTLPLVSDVSQKDWTPLSHARAGPIEQLFNSKYFDDFEIRTIWPGTLKNFNRHQILLLWLSWKLSLEQYPGNRWALDLLELKVLAKYPGSANKVKSFILFEENLASLAEFLFASESKESFNSTVSWLERKVPARHGRKIRFYEYIQQSGPDVIMTRKKKPKNKQRVKGYTDGKGKAAPESLKAIRDQVNSAEYQQLVRQEVNKKIEIEFPEVLIQPHLREIVLRSKGL